MRESFGAMDVSLRFLGSLRLLIDGVHVNVERAQTRAFLGLLARHPGSTVPATTVMESLWADKPPRQPVDALRTVATRARKALGHDDLLRSVGSGYVLDLPATSIDLHVFREAAERAESAEELRSALALWNGSPFADCGRVRRLQLFAEDLEARRWDLVERYLQSTLRAGDHDAALSIGLPLLDERPTDERLSALLTIGLARAGREAEARALVAQVRAAILHDDPDAELDDLDRAEERISTELPPTTDRSRAGRPSRNPLAGHVIDLLGRHDELAQLRAHAVEARTQGRFTLLIGESGVGKTTLAASFAAQLGWRTWSIRCGTSSTDDLDMASRLLSAAGGNAADVAATFAPAILDDLRRFMGRGPTAIILDDLQWASEVELLVLRSIVRQGLLPGLFMLATIRPLDSLPEGVPDVLGEIVREPSVTTVPLDGLSAEAVQKLARRIRPELTPRQCRRLHELTRGNAFAVRSLCELEAFDVDRPISDLPSALLLLTGQRLDLLPRLVQDALELAALLDPPIDFGAVAGLRGSDRLAILDLLRPAFDHHVLVEDPPGEVRFDHELTRHALQQRTPPAIRRALHDRLARHFDERGRSVLAGYHLAAALPDTDHPRPVPVLLNAAESALTNRQYAVAIECFEAAEGLLDPATARRIALRRGFALEQAGRQGPAAEIYGRVAHDALAVDDREALARAGLAGLAQGVVGGNGPRKARLELSVAHPPDDHRLELEVLVQLSIEHGYAGEVTPASLRERAAVVADDTAADQALLAFLDIQDIPLGPIDDAALERITKVIDLAGEGGDLDLVLRAIEQSCAANIALGDLDELRRALTLLEAQVRVRPSPRQRWAAAMFRGIVADLSGGGIEAAAPLAREALDLGRNLELPDAVNAFAIFRLSAAVRTGGLAKLEPLVEQATLRPSAIPSWHAVHASTLRDAGRVADAVAAARAFQHRFIEGRHVFPHLGYALTVASLAGLDDPEAAELRTWAAARLEAWTGNLIVVGSGAGCFGPADLYLALAAAPVPAVAETWATAWLDGSWSGLASRLSALAGR